MSHRRRRLLHVATITSWLTAAGLLLLRDPGPLRLSETLVLLVVVVLTMSSTISAALAPVVAQNVLLARLVREECQHCSELLPAGRTGEAGSSVIPLRSAGRRRGTGRV